MGDATTPIVSTHKKWSRPRCVSVHTQLRHLPN